MKQLLVIFTILIFGSAIAGVKSELAMGYRIINDAVDGSVATNKCLIVGEVTRDGIAVGNALVYSQSARAVKTNDQGKFRILLDTLDKYLTVSKGENLIGYIEGYPFSGGHKIQCEVYLQDVNEILIVDKPVIYAYSTNQIDVSLALKTKMDLTFTYPKIMDNDSWQFGISDEGLNIGEKVYPYLFWEAFSYEGLKPVKQEGQLDGFFIMGEDVVAFLEEKLSELGLNVREQTDFITYWAPRMIHHDYVYINFRVDAAYDEISTMNISPQPDEMRRVFMTFTTVDDIYEFPEVELFTPDYISLPKLTRAGFTIVEWGGAEVSLEILKTQL